MPNTWRVYTLNTVVLWILKEYNILNMKNKIIFVIIIVVGLLGLILWKNIYIKKNTVNTVSSFNIIPSRSPDEGCTWQPVQNKSLGISMLTEQCNPPVYSFSVIGNYIEQENVNGPLYASETRKAIEIFTKPANQKIEDAIKTQFINNLPRTFSKTCIVVTETYNLGNNATERYLIEPNSARKAILDKEAGTDIPDYSECGTYAFDPDGEAYFEYQPNNSKTKFMFVSIGNGGEPYFDQDSIKLND
jgi:hypothetical protein